MEQAQRFYGIKALGKRNSEWDLNSWKWDGDLFIASQVDPASAPYNIQVQKLVPIQVIGHSSNSSSSCSEDLHPEAETLKGDSRDLDRKRRVIDVDDVDDEAGTLSLKLGVQSQEALDGNSGKKTKLAAGALKSAVCQVECCGADLSDAKDYHRRHKVCELHSKANKAVVGNVLQRFCQQCSRFHTLQEFDEGKRSCRRRLAGHNKRRRKTQAEPVISGQPVNDEQANNYILMSLLRILSNMHTNNRPDPAADHDLVAHLLRSFACQPGLPGLNDLAGLVHESQKLINSSLAGGNTAKIAALMSATPPRPPRPTSTHVRMPSSEVLHELMHSVGGRNGNIQSTFSQKPESVSSKDSPPSYSEIRDSPAGRTKVNNFDLNDIYVDSDDGFEDLERSPETVTFGTGSVGCSSWVQQDSQHSSPAQASGNSEPPSSSSVEAQSRTDRIVFKLFGKEPSEFPMSMRGQILDWLTHIPTDMESYIRPGCVILTIYLRLAEPMWEELSSDLGSSLSRLLDTTDDSFWRSGWAYTRVQDQIVFSYNGQILIDSSLPSQNSYCSRILNVTPIAVCMSELAQFQIKGSNLSRSSTRLLCAIEGKYLTQEAHQDLTSDDDSLMEDNEIECVSYACSIPSLSGRGFIEVEDNGCSNSFFPFIVAEKDVCSEIRDLESILDSTNTHETNEKPEAKKQAMDFIHEMGWLLHRCQMKSRLGHQNPEADLFSFKRFSWLMEFSIDHNWCAVVKKLLDILLDGSVGYGEHPSLNVALSEMDLLHRAVRRNCRALVELLLRYVPVTSSQEFSKQNVLFRPDVKGPAGLTPLHIAAGRDGSEAVLDALTDDPGKVGIEAWKTALDSTGSTPEDYARLRGHYEYIHLVQRKTGPKPANGSVVVDMQSLEIATSLSRRNAGRSCHACENKLTYGVSGRTAWVYRPAMLSMVAIAAVCVCVALFFKTSPVVYIVKPFRWESVDFGSI
ncbi:hypothetical protein V2J09_000462 [Rumex salicifolius]